MWDWSWDRVLYSVLLTCLSFPQYHPVLVTMATRLVLKLGRLISFTLFFFSKLS